MIYAMSDIHGCFEEFEAALALVDLSGDNKLLLLGDYVHGGDKSYSVLDRIIALQQRYGSDKVIALMGNHEEAVLDGYWQISADGYGRAYEGDVDRDDEYIGWIENLPLYYFEGKTIFCHAGIDEEAGEYWELGTDDNTFLGKFPAQTGKFHCGGLDLKIVAGHIGTAEIANNPRFHDIFFDGESHYYIDGTVLDSGEIPVLAVDTVNDKYYRVTDSGLWIVEPYDENW
ncbi:MAG: metallophosphoesterase [Ruminococcus sp.]|nr:metallophosphoesterase [Ruminococcus sp.]